MKSIEFENTSVQEQLSALHDGELSASQAAALVKASLEDGSVMLQWRAMSTISTVLREQQGGLAAMPKGIPIARDAGTQKQPDSASRKEAANDGVFRWKMVAGLAAFAAVGSLVWGLLGNLGEKSGLQNGTLAQSQNAPTAAAISPTLIAVGSPKSVQIDGQEVTMIRDPRLDELLAAHKQFGGISALQQPAGSLRSVSLGGARP